MKPGRPKGTVSHYHPGKVLPILLPLIIYRLLPCHFEGFTQIAKEPMVQNVGDGTRGRHRSSSRGYTVGRLPQVMGMAFRNRSEIQPPVPSPVSIPAVAERSGGRSYCGWGLSPMHQWVWDVCGTGPAVPQELGRHRAGGK
jgi:hypothetical protein